MKTPSLAPLRRYHTWFVVVAFALAAPFSAGLLAQSFFPQRPDDPRAVDFTTEAFGAHADGAGDDADALQAAVNRVQETTRIGVVLIPAGRYRLGKTVRVWQGIRLIGYGATRPVFVLGRDTPGFQSGTGRYLIHFADNRPPEGGPIVDASEFTFYSGMSNINFELQDGNPAAIAVRFHVAQHSALTHMDFRVGSARAALEDIGNQASDIHVHGGQYGIITKRTAPVWQFLLMDSSFDGQRTAAIQTMEAGMTLVRVKISNTPVALQIAPGEVEQLYARDLQLENIRDAAFAAGNWRNAHSAVTLTNIACTNVPHFFAGDPPVDAPAPHYVMEHFSLGLEIGADGRDAGIHLRHRERARAQPAPAVASDIPPLPPMAQWINVRSLGAKGDGTTDDTAALRTAIERHAALFFPSGIYRVSGSLTLKPDTALIGLNPGNTQIALLDGSEGFAGEGDPIGVVVAPRSGRNIISSLAVATGVRNPRAAGVIWLAGPASMLDDVSFPVRGGGGFFGGRGPGLAGRGATGATGGAPATPPAPPPGGFGRGPSYSNTQAADLLVKDGGGGIFRGNWPHDTNGKVGLRVENTSTPCKIYQMSVEHHARIETQFHNVRNWEIYALQTEEENPAGAEAYAIDIQDSSDLLFANTYMYRVSRNVLPKTHAAIVRRSDRIAFENMKVFSQTRLAFDHAVLEEGSGAAVRPHFFTRFTVNREMPTAVARPLPAVFAPGAALTQLASGFSNASGLTVGTAGELYFSDAANKKIFRWNEAAKKVDLLAEIPGQPQVLGFVAPSHLLAIANEKTVYRIKTDGTGAAETVAETAEVAPDTTLLLPVGLHNQWWVMQDMIERRGFLFRRGSNTAFISRVTDEPRAYFYAPETKTAIMAGGTWRPNLQSSQLAAFKPGTAHYLTSEDDGRTYLATLASYRSLTATVFAERGGTSVVADRAGNVYLASDQVWIYDRTGKEIGVIELPERPASLAFGGSDRQTLFIGARGALYAIRTAAPGQ
ncbi:MAG: SMP-30/gluconolactonase/LRE family protein [Verrucomicrobia bacterium]|nr:SMP-30/gluconolactonase/LRE family protein [Verrucomicrobiota bacterium]